MQFSIVKPENRRTSSFAMIRIRRILSLVGMVADIMNSNKCWGSQVAPKAVLGFANWKNNRGQRTIGDRPRFFLQINLINGLHKNRNVVYPLLLMTGKEPFSCAILPTAAGDGWSGMDIEHQLTYQFE